MPTTLEHQLMLLLAVATVSKCYTISISWSKQALLHAMAW
jgi:hypothetical protein